jgi:hypothetical protein
VLSEAALGAVFGIRARVVETPEGPVIAPVAVAD